MTSRSEGLIWIHAFFSEKDHQEYIVYLHHSRDGLKLRVCDFINVWEKMYEGTVSGGTQEINELNDCLVRNKAEVTESSTTTNTLRLAWGEHDVELTRSTSVDVPGELRWLLSYSIERMNMFKQNVQVLERKLGQEKSSSPVVQETSVIVKSGPGLKTKRLPGQSIINPLNKRKKAAGGVQFSDN